MAKRKPKGRTEKFIPEYMRARSEASKKAWAKRWDRGTAPIGEKGRRYIERTYGPSTEPLQRRDYLEFVDEYEYDDYDFYESEY